MTFKLIIFDCDGVLVDTEPIHNLVLTQMLAEIGLSFTLEECMKTFVGRSPKENLQTIEKLLGTPPPANFLEEFKLRAYVESSEKIQPIKGIKTALSEIFISKCVASSSDPDTIQKNLIRTELLDHFKGKIFSAIHVLQGKPAPDLFLHAAKEMNVNPKHCAVIEDSISGIQAGLAAGMTVYGYSGTFPAKNLKEAGAHFVFDDMKNLPQLLEQYS